MRIAIHSLGIPRAGTTLQLNSFKAAVDCLVNNGWKSAHYPSLTITKHHPSCFNKDTNVIHSSSPFHSHYQQSFCLNKAATSLVLGIHRDSLDIIASRLRIRGVKDDSKLLKIHATRIFISLINDIEFENKVVSDVIRNGNMYYRDSYSLIHNMSLRTLILSRIIILKQAFKINTSIFCASKQSLSDSSIIKSLDQTYKLSRKTAIQNQESLDSDLFDAYDKNTGIHGNHLGDPCEINREHISRFFQNPVLRHWVNKVNKKSLSLMSLNSFNYCTH